MAGVLLLALVGLALFSPLCTQTWSRQVAFAAAVVLLIGEFAAIGAALGRGAAGVIIDTRNCMSLSKLQACAWTILVLAALLVAAAFNLSSGGPDALKISIPADLLAAMGISAVSLAAAPALLSIKASQAPSDRAKDTASAQLVALGAAPAVPNIGKLMTNSTIGEAQWTDMITGDEVGNFAAPDLGKIQQLLVTLLLLGVYGMLIWKSFALTGPIKQLPPLDQGFIWLMGISHASYLAYKAAPHTT